jgi:serine/threonine-protein kinase
MLPREEAYARALAAAERAVALDESLAEAHASLAQARKNRFDWAAAERSFKRAIELKPGYAKARHWYSVFLTQHARFAEAIAEIRIAMSLDPVSKEPKLQFAAVLALMRRYDDAIAQYEEALKMDGEFPLAYRHMARACINKGDYVRAARALEEARRRMSAGAEDSEFNADLGYLYAKSGRQQDALAIARALTSRYERAGEAVAGNIASIYAGLGRRAEAIDWLEKAAAVRDPEAGYLKVDPVWDALRGEPRFASLLKNLGFTN